MYNMRVDGPMVPHCPGGTPNCSGVNLSPAFVNGNNLTAIACGSPTNPASNGVAPHHCRASMISDTGGTSWTNNAGERALLGDGIADLPDGKSADAFSIYVLSNANVPACGLSNEKVATLQLGRTAASAVARRAGW